MEHAQRGEGAYAFINAKASVLILILMEHAQRERENACVCR